VIAAAVVGGASLAGGRGSALGVVLGALIIQMINSGIVILGIDQNYSQIIIGTVVIAAVVLDNLNSWLARRRLQQGVGHRSATRRTAPEPSNAVILARISRPPGHSAPGHSAPEHPPPGYSSSSPLRLAALHPTTHRLRLRPAIAFRTGAAPTSITRRGTPASFVPHLHPVSACAP
jgi:hypothetical protein